MGRSDPGVDPRLRSGSRLSWDSDLQFLPGVGPRKAELLGRLGLVTLGHLLRHVPRRYEDRRSLVPIARAGAGGPFSLHGVLASVRERSLGAGRSIVEGRLADPADPLGRCIDVVWFNQPYLLDWLRPGVALYVYGSVKSRRGRLQMQAPEFEIDTETQETDGSASAHVQRIVPVYSLTRGVHQRFLRALLYRTLQLDLELGDGPHDYFQPGGPGLLDAYRSLHFPVDWADLQRGVGRLRFDEYFTFSSHVAFRRHAFRADEAPSFIVTAELDRKIRGLFPFTFTPDQERAIQDITMDIRGPRAMYRLLQGDVGTGKTAVALYAMLASVRHRRQAALMAPTEILAEQHFKTIRSLLAAHPVNVTLLTGSHRGKAREERLGAIASGAAHIVIGTHALVQPTVRFHRLGLVVIDEQHRFGVKERMRLRKKSQSPHMIVMSATPIPRSLCLTCYGDLDLTTLRSRPAGRSPVKTVLVPPRKRAETLERIRAEVAGGRQAYFVYPLIEESEALTLPAATEAHRRLSTEVFPELSVELLHGALPAAEKERIIDRFRAGATQILVATVVVEVGIDVANATIIFLEDATRFGLAQLHQLRGRVGRGEAPGTCYVGLGRASREAEARLRIFAATLDGFKIAEEDLKLRGPGDYLGLRQSGRQALLHGNPLEDLERFTEVSKLAEEFWSHPGHRDVYTRRWARHLKEERPVPAPAAPAGEEAEAFLGFD